MAPKEYDGVLLASFGGPEGQDDVIPFLRNVTRGRGIPDERLEEVSHHYRANGGISPINQQNRELKAALEAELAARGIDLPVLWGNRNWDPYIPQTLQDAYDAGHRRLLMVTTSAYSCYSSCRQYREDIGMALTETGLDGRLEVDKVRQYFDHPGFVEPFIEGTAAGLAEVRAQLAAAGNPDAPVHVLFATHSIPTRDAEAAGRSDDEPREFAEDSAYVAQHLATGAEVMRRVEAESGLTAPWSLVYQSRSGAPHVPVAGTGHQRRHRGPGQAGRQGHRDRPPGLRQRPHGGGLGPRHRSPGDLPRTWASPPRACPRPERTAASLTGLVDLICERTVANNIADRPARHRPRPLVRRLPSRLLRQLPRRKAHHRRSRHHRWHRARPLPGRRAGAPEVTVRIGTRASKLALTQTQQTADRLAAVGGFPVELVHIRTDGDVLTGSLSQMGGTGVFVAALRDALLRNECDVAVHSLKDLPTGSALGLTLAATPRRVDVRDVLCARDGLKLADLPKGARVGTGSPRRAAQLRAVRPDLDIVDIRGNVDTRLGRVPGLPGNATDAVVDGKSCDLDAVVLAAAGLERIGRLDTVTEYLETDIMLPARGPGIAGHRMPHRRGAAPGRLHRGLAGRARPGPGRP